MPLPPGHWANCRGGKTLPQYCGSAAHRGHPHRIRARPVFKHQHRLFGRTVDQSEPQHPLQRCWSDRVSRARAVAAIYRPAGRSHPHCRGRRRLQPGLRPRHAADCAWHRPGGGPRDHRRHAHEGPHPTHPPVFERGLSRRAVRVARPVAAGQHRAMVVYSAGGHPRIRRLVGGRHRIVPGATGPAPHTGR